MAKLARCPTFVLPRDAQLFLRYNLIIRRGTLVRVKLATPPVLYIFFATRVRNLQLIYDVVIQLLIAWLFHTTTLIIKRLQRELQTPWECISSSKGD